MKPCWVERHCLHGRFITGEPVGGLTGTKCLQGIMIASQSAGQVHLCAAHKQQEVIHMPVICSHFFFRELHGDNTPPLQTQECKDGLFESDICMLNREIRPLLDNFSPPHIGLIRRTIQMKSKVIKGLNPITAVNKMCFCAECQSTAPQTLLYLRIPSSESWLHALFMLQ